MAAAVRRRLRGLGWVLAGVAVWVASLPLAWLLVNGAHVVVTGDRQPPTSFWEVAVLGYLYAGVLPLVLVLAGLWYLGRVGRPPFRVKAILLSLLGGGWFGFYLVLLADPAIQVVLVAWAAFGAVVPRPPDPA